MPYYRQFIYFYIYNNSIYNARKQSFICWILDYYIAFASIICCENSKERSMHKLIPTILTAFLDFSWFIENSIISVFLFGEYPYPTDDDTE